MNLSNLPLDVLLHIVQFLSKTDQVKLAALQNQNINNALECDVLQFYDKVYKFIPCGIWFSPTQQKIYEITLKPGLVLHINYYPMFTKKQLCFNKKKGLQLLKNFHLVDKNKQLYFNKTSWRIMDKSLVKKINGKLGIVRYMYKNICYNTIDDYIMRTNVCIFLDDKKVIVKKFNRNNKEAMDTFIYKNNKLIYKIEKIYPKNVFIISLKHFN